MMPFASDSFFRIRKSERERQARREGGVETSRGFFCVTTEEQKRYSVSNGMIS